MRGRVGELKERLENRTEAREEISEQTLGEGWEKFEDGWDGTDGIAWFVIGTREVIGDDGDDLGRVEEEEGEGRSEGVNSLLERCERSGEVEEREVGQVKREGGWG